MIFFLLMLMTSCLATPYSVTNCTYLSRIIVSAVPGDTLFLQNDIDCTSITFVVDCFSGFLDGRNFAIQHLSNPLIGTLNGTLSNLTISNSLFSGVQMGAFATTVARTGVLNKCSSLNNTFMGCQLGGIAATNNGTIINSKSVANSFSTPYMTTRFLYIGGICGIDLPGSVLANSISSENNFSSMNVANVGGISGGENGNLSHCLSSYNNFTFTGSGGGISGSNSGSISFSCSFSNTFNTLSGAIVGTNSGNVLSSTYFANHNATSCVHSNLASSSTSFCCMNSTCVNSQNTFSEPVTIFMGTTALPTFLPLRTNLAPLETLFSIVPISEQSTSEAQTSFQETSIPSITNTVSTSNPPWTVKPSLATKQASHMASSLSPLQTSSFAPSSLLSTSVSSPSPLTTAPTKCAYQVLNCQNCEQNAPQVDLSQVNVSCNFSGGYWTWSFTPKAGTLTVNSPNFEISTNSTVIVQGNLTQTPMGTIIVNYTNSSQNNKTVPLNVEGCVSLKGNITVNLQTQPQQGTSQVQIISYSCSQQANISSSQVQVVPNYNGSSCDTIDSKTLSHSNSFGVSLTSTLGNKCKSGGVSKGLLIGLSVAIPCVVILITAAIIGVLVHRRNVRLKRARKDLEKFKNKL